MTTRFILGLTVAYTGQYTCISCACLGPSKIECEFKVGELKQLLATWVGSKTFFNALFDTLMGIYYYSMAVFEAI